MSPPALTETPETRTGRPRMFQDAESVHATIDAYFATAEQKHTTPTVAGLCRALECTRQTLLNYEDYNDAGPIVDAIKRARQRVEEATVSLLLQPKSGVHPAGPIFVLKNCHGYQDTQVVQHQGGVLLGVVAADEQLRAILPALSPPPERLIASSPIPQIAVTIDSVEAKATPNRGVSPRDVAE